MIKEKGKLAAISVKPKTPIETVYPYLDKLGMVLVMTVEPGFGGQKFMADQMDKIKQLREWLDDVNPDCLIEVDGGVCPDNARRLIDAGAEILVAGSAVFKAEDPAKVIAALR